MNIQPLNKKLGYNFADPELLKLALSHRSVGAHNNERLEFLGDSIINLIIAAELFKRFDKASEGQLTRMRAQLVCADMLKVIAKDLSLQDFIVLGSGEQRSGGSQRASILADAVEAIVGAIYLDSKCDFSLVQTVVLTWYTNKFNIFTDTKDAKTILQELLQAQKLPLPEYQVTRIEGEQHAQIFYVSCKIALLPNPENGIGDSRRKAEQMAAEKILGKLNASNT